MNFASPSIDPGLRVLFGLESVGECTEPVADRNTQLVALFKEDGRVMTRTNTRWCASQYDRSPLQRATLEEINKLFHQVGKVCLPLTDIGLFPGL